MSDTEVKVKINGDSSDAERAIAKATIALASGAATMQEAFRGVTGVFEALQSKMAVVAAVLAGGKAFKESIEEALKLNAEAMSLANALGTTAEEANVLNAALGNVFLDKDTYLTAVKQVTKELNSNEDAFRQLGVATRDNQGKLKSTQEIITQSVEALKEFKAGTDRNTMAQQIFGKSYSEVLKLAKLTPQVMQEAKEEVESYHKELNPEQVMAYRVAMENVGDVFDGIKIAVAQAVMPALTRLAQWFGEIGPTVVREFRAVLFSLQSTFYAVAVPVHALIQTFLALTESITAIIGAVVDATKAIASGDWQGAARAATAAADTIEYSWKTRLDNVKDYAADAVKSLQDTYDRMTDNVSAPSADIPGGKGSKNSFQIKEKEKKSGEEKTRTGQWEVELANIKMSYELQNNLRKYDLEQEVKYWQDRLDQAKVGTKEYAEVLKKLNEVKLEKAKESFKQAQEISQIEIGLAKTRAENELAVDQDNAQAMLDLGQISNAQFIEMQRSFENRRYEIQRAAIQSRLELLAKDPNTSPAEMTRINSELEALQLDHARKMNQIQIEQNKEGHKLFSDLSDAMSNLWDKGLQSMMNGTLRWSNAYKAVIASVGQVFAKFMADKAKAWLQTEVLQTAYTRVQTLVRGALEKAGLIQSTSTTAAAATANISANAAVAGAGAAASQSSIPIIGPALAIAAMGAMLATVGGLKGSIKSARNGYDIPSGVNPVVQLHEQEMVLPRAQANAVREMASGGGGQASQAQNIAIHIHAMDSQDVKRLIMSNGNHIAEAVRQQVRNGGKIPS